MDTTFNIDKIVTTATKVAYHTKLLQAEKEINMVRFKNPLAIKEWLIDDQEYNTLNK